MFNIIPEGLSREQELALALELGIESNFDLKLKFIAVRNDSLNIFVENYASIELVEDILIRIKANQHWTPILSIDSKQSDRIQSSLIFNFPDNSVLEHLTGQTITQLKEFKYGAIDHDVQLSMWEYLANYRSTIKAEPLLILGLLLNITPIPIRTIMHKGTQNYIDSLTLYSIQNTSIEDLRDIWTLNRTKNLPDPLSNQKHDIVQSILNMWYPDTRLISVDVS